MPDPEINTEKKGFQFQLDIEKTRIVIQYPDYSRAKTKPHPDPGHVKLNPPENVI